jgi:uncharacterized protein (TIGR02466 family)
MHKIEASINQCIGLFHDKKYQQVVDSLPKILKQIPFNGQLIYFLAMSERHLGNFGKSEQYFYSLLNRAPNNIGYLCGYGNLLIAAEKYTQAETQIKLALKINSNHFDCNFNLARLYGLQDKYQLAERFASKALAIKPNQQKCCLALINYQLNLGLVDKAILGCQRFIENFPDHNLIVEKLALIFRDEEKDDACILFFDDMLKEFPDDVELQKLFITNAIALGRFQNVEPLITKLLIQNPNDFSLHENYFKIIWRQGKATYFDNFNDLFERITNPEIIYSFCKKLIKLDLLEQALVAIEKTFYLSENIAISYLIKGYVLREQGAFKLSLATLEQGARKYIRNTEIKYELAITNLCMNDYAQALLVSKQILDIDNLHQGYWALYASCLRYCGDEETYSKLFDYNKLVKIYSLSALSEYQSVDLYHSALLADIEKHHSSKRYPIEQSVRHGLQTLGNLFASKSNILQGLKDKLSLVVDTHLSTLNKDNAHPLLRSVGREYYFSGAWSIEMKKEGFHENHYHQDGWISGSYYLVIPDAVNQNGKGWLKLGQASLSRWLKQEAEYYVKPKVGQVVLFPSYMWHGTVPLDSNERRVTVAFDVSSKI